MHSGNSPGCALAQPPSPRLRRSANSFSDCGTRPVAPFAAVVGSPNGRPQRSAPATMAPGCPIRDVAHEPRPTSASFGRCPSAGADAKSRHASRSSDTPLFEPSHAGELGPALEGSGGGRDRRTPRDRDRMRDSSTASNEAPGNCGLKRASLQSAGRPQLSGGTPHRVRQTPDFQRPPPYNS